jgi:arabinose-5-phosphate isomerase
MSVVEVKTKEDQTGLAIAQSVLKTEAEGLEALAETLNGDFLEAVDLITNIEGRVIITGMGKSGHIARKIAATMASTGTPAFFVHPGEASHGDMGMIVRGDVVLALSNSGESRELNDLIDYTRRFAIPLISVTREKESTLGSRSDIALILPNVPEACPNGLAPTTSTTMTLALGDALAIALLERKNFTAKDFKTFHPGGKLGQQLLTVSEIMHKGDALPLVSETAGAEDVFQIMTDKSLGCIGFVNEEGLLTGMLTDGDIRRNLSSDILNKTALDIMTKSPKTIHPGTLVAEAIGIMNDVTGEFRQITCIFVVDEEKKPVGLLHIHDCLKAGLS